MSDFLKVSMSFIAMDKPIPKIGPIKGEISIAPITTAVEFALSPIEATKIEQIKNIVQDIQNLIDEHEHTNMDGNVRFMDFGASSLDVMVVYYIDSMDYKIFLEVKQEINFKIMEIIEKHGSDFAFPSQTIYLEKTE